MKLLYNSTLIASISHWNMLLLPLSNIASIGNRRYWSLGRAFKEPTHQPGLLVLPNYKRNKHYHYRHSSSSTIELPIYLLPGLALYSTTNNNKQKSQFYIATGAYCLAKTEGSPDNPKHRHNCTPFGCGEDSYVISSEHELILVLGVADGVGGWRKRGVNPADFSQTLMKHAHEAAREILSSDPQAPRSLIKEAYRRLVGDFRSGKAKPFGSSTACIVMIDRESGGVQVGNLGDSGVIILSKNDSGLLKIKFKSKTQQHASTFNMPYQLTLAPPHGTMQDTTDLTAHYSSLAVGEGDVVLVVTDGILDNIFDDEMEEIVNRSLGSLEKRHARNEVPKLLAREIVRNARIWAADEQRESPFTLAAREHNLHYIGGKEDDMTVVAAIIYGNEK